MKSLKNQSIIIFIITAISVIFLYSTSDDSKILYEAEIDILVQDNNTYYGNDYRYMYKERVAKYIKEENLSFEYEDFNKYWITSTKKKIEEESRKLLIILRKLNNENIILTKQLVDEQKDYINDVLLKFETFSIPHQPYNHQQLYDRYSYKIDAMTDDVISYINKSEKLIDNQASYNKEVLNNFSIEEHFLFRKSKTRLEKINIAIIFGIIAEFFCIIFYRKKFRSY